MLTARQVTVNAQHSELCRGAMSTLLLVWGSHLQQDLDAQCLLQVVVHKSWVLWAQQMAFCPNGLKSLHNRSRSMLQWVSPAVQAMSCQS